jgi:FtsX-like permease family
MPADFEVPVRNIEMLMPFAFTPAQQSDQERGNEFSMMIARLRPDASVTQLNAQMRTIVDRLIERLPRRGPIMRNSGFTGLAVPVRNELVGDARTPLLLLQAGVVIVLLIACANVANLLLMRASGRSRELVIRTSLGATRWHIVRQLMAEGAVLAALGAFAGIAVAAIGLRLLTRMMADQVPSATVASIGPVVLLFTAAITVFAGALFGIVPANSMTANAVSATTSSERSRVDDLPAELLASLSASDPSRRVADSGRGTAGDEPVAGAERTSRFLNRSGAVGASRRPRSSLSGRDRAARVLAASARSGRRPSGRDERRDYRSRAVWRC